MPITPDLPLLPEEDSMLSRKFGREIANYFSGSPLNRLSFLRGDREFLRSAFSHPSTGFLLLKDLAPLVQQHDDAQLAFANTADVTPLTGQDPFAKTEEEQIRDYNSEEAHPVILFLGIDDKESLPARPAPEGPFTYKEFKGSPYFAIDVTPRGKDAEVASRVIEAVKQKGLVFHEKGPRHMGLHAGQGT